MAISNNGNLGIVALQTSEERAVRLPHAPPHGKPAPLLADEPRSAPDVVHLLAAKWVSYPCNRITKGKDLFNNFFCVSFNKTFQTTKQVKEVSPYGITAAIGGTIVCRVYVSYTVSP